jgi:hypothetical protein
MTSVSVEFECQSIGPIRLEAGRPVFPPLPDEPGLYRFAFDWAGRPASHYIGETDRLRRRAQHYRTPGPSQKTNLRVNEELVRALSNGTAVICSIITSAVITLDHGATVTLDFARKTGRLIVENAAMAAVLAERQANPATAPVLMNRPGVGEAEWS